MTRPRDVKVGPDIPNLLWCKQKWVCRNQECGRRQFTEQVPQVPARARFTGRARAEMAAAVLDANRSVAEVAGSFGASWNTCHAAVVAVADLVLAEEPDPVRVLGIDETRRGRGCWRLDPVTRQRVWVDRFDTGLVDVGGGQGLLAQVNGRDAAAVIGWLDDRGQAFKDAITHVTIDMSAGYAAAVAAALPHAQVVVDRFHVIRRANQAIDEVRRRVTQQHRGRRGRRVDPEWVSRRRLLRGAERLTDTQAATLWAKITDPSVDPAGDLAAAWIAKELLRKVFACADTGGLTYEIRAALDAFYTFVAATAVPEIHTLAHTIDRWQQPIIAAIRTGLSNATSEGLNRIVKHVGRTAFGFRNPTNQRRRIRWACTRRTRQASPKVTARPC